MGAVTIDLYDTVDCSGASTTLAEDGVEGGKIRVKTHLTTDCTGPTISDQTRTSGECGIETVEGETFHSRAVVKSGVAFLYLYDDAECSADSEFSASGSNALGFLCDQCSIVGDVSYDITCGASSVAPAALFLFALVFALVM